MKRLTEVLVSWGPLGIFILTLLDSAGVPNPGAMDALFLLLAVADPSKAYLCAALAVVGSLIGSMILFYIARKGGEPYLAKVTSGPRGTKFRTWFQRYGLVTVFIPALLPIPMPLKAFVICSGALGVPPLWYFLVVLAARVPRYFGLAYLGAQLGKNSLGWLNTHKWHMLEFAAGLAVFLFLLIRLAERIRRTEA